MFMQLTLRVRTRFATLRISHRVVYAVLAGLYLGSCFGLDKTIIGGGLALAYAALALDRS